MKRAPGVLLYVSLSATLCFFAVCAQAKEKPQWQFIWSNDAFLGSDNQFTNGLLLRHHSPYADSLNSLDPLLPGSLPLAGLMLPEEYGLVYRQSWTLGHNMQTPDDDSTSAIMLNDLPFLGMFGGSLALTAQDNYHLSAFQVMVGAVGPVALGERLQRNAHKLVNADDPNGWGNQLDNEPLLNIYLMRKFKFYNNGWMDATIDVDTGLGNFFTFGQSALELRFGDRPGGFAHQALPLGHSIDHDPRLPEPGQSYFYGTLIARGSGFLWAMPREGNLLRSDNEWTENNTIDARSFLGQIDIGLHWEKEDWGLHANFVFTTDTIKHAERTLAEDPKNNYGAITWEWKFTD